MRIHKSLGYGLQGYRMDAGVVEKCMSLDWDRKKFVRWARRNKRDIMKFLSGNHPHIPVKKGHDGGWRITFSLMSLEKGPWSICDLVTYDGECGFEDVIVFAPPEQARGWRRYDDIIDYHEAASSGTDPKVEAIDTCGIFPYVGMVRTKMPGPGVLKRDADIEAFRVLAPREWRVMAKASVGRTNKISRHFREDYRPVIPLSVGCLFWLFKDAFEDPSEAYNALRPMVYTYWG